MTDLFHEALDHLNSLMDEAYRRRIADARAAAMATVDAEGRPSVRSIYIMPGPARELVFFTHRESGKARHLRSNPNVGLLFFWPALQVQIAMDARAVAASDALAQACWRKRPHESQLAAWVSHQSEPTAKDRLEADRLVEQRRAFDFQQVPMPPQWCAFELRLRRIEFWEGGWRRLHTRTRYWLDEDGHWARDHYEP